MTETTRIEFRVAYDTRAYGETSTWEFPMSDPGSRDEAFRRLGTAEENERRKSHGRFNFRVQQRTVVESPWEPIGEGPGLR